MNRTDELGLGRQPLKTVWEYIINDFITATNNLPESYNSEPQRATAVSYTHLDVYKRQLMRKVRKIH